MSGGWCQSLRMEASLFIEYSSIVGLLVVCFYSQHFFTNWFRLSIGGRNTTEMIMSQCIIPGSWASCILKHVALEVAHSHRRILRSVSSIRGVVLTSRPPLVYSHLYPQALLNGCLPGQHKSSATSGFTKMKNSLRFGVKWWSIQNLLFNYCLYANRFFFKLNRN